MAVHKKVVFFCRSFLSRPDTDLKAEHGFANTDLLVSKRLQLFLLTGWNDIKIKCGWGCRPAWHTETTKSFIIFDIYTNSERAKYKNYPRCGVIVTVTWRELDQIALYLYNHWTGKSTTERFCRCRIVVNLLSLVDFRSRDQEMRSRIKILSFYRAFIINLMVLKFHEMIQDGNLYDCTI